MDFLLKSAPLLTSCCVQEYKVFALGGTLADALHVSLLFHAASVRRAIFTLSEMRVGPHKLKHRVVLSWVDCCQIGTSGD